MVDGQVVASLTVAVVVGYVTVFVVATYVSGLGVRITEGALLVQSLSIFHCVIVARNERESPQGKGATRKDSADCRACSGSGAGVEGVCWFW